MSRIIQICNDLPNVGDRLAPYITEKLFGLSVIPVFKSLPLKWRCSAVLGGLGSFLGYYGDWTLHVWGTGYEPGYIDSAHRKNPGSRSRWIVYAVRGHVSRVALKLSDDVAIGDPAVLMPRIYSPRTAPHETVRYFCHFDNAEGPGFDYDHEVLSARMDPLRAIDMVAASGFVFTESLHIAILAHAYGIPWAWSLNQHSRGMVKWFDWFSSIGVKGECFTPAHLAQARKWYDVARRAFSQIDEERLLSVFPRHIAIS